MLNRQHGVLIAETVFPPFEPAFERHSPALAMMTLLLPLNAPVLAVPPKCSKCAFFTTRDKGCARVLITAAKTEAYFERAQVVRSYTFEDVCGPQGKGFVAAVGLTPM